MASQVTLSAVGNVLKKVIQPTIKPNVFAKSLLAALFFGYNPTNGEEVRKNVPGVRFENNTLYFDILTDLNASVMGYAEDETLRDGRSRDAQGSLSIATVAGMFTITKQVLNIRNTGAIVDKLMQEKRVLEQTFAFELSRQLYGDGSGTVATTDSSGTSTTTVPLAASVNGDIDYSEFFPIGSYIKVGSSSVVQVTGKSTNSLTVDSAISFSQGDNIVKVTGDGNAASELTGIAKIVDTSGSYAGIDPTSVPVWVAAYKDTTSEALSADKLHTAYFKGNRLGNVDVIIMNQSLYKKFGSLEEGNKRYNTGELIVGWKGIQYMDGSALVVLDYMCPDDRVYFLSTDELFAGELQPFEFENEGGQLLYRQTKKLSYEVVASWMGNVGTFTRRAHAVLTGKTD